MGVLMEAGEYMDRAEGGTRTRLRLAGLWLVFLGTCLQATFQEPYIVLVPGERTNLFSSLLCAVTFGCVCLYGKRQRLPFSSPALWLSSALVCLGLLSSIFSLSGTVSFMRLFSILAPGLGGFWTARILLATPGAQKVFKGLCLCSLAVILFLCLKSYHLTGKIESIPDVNVHALVNMITLLSFAPLSLRGRKWGPSFLLGGTFLSTILLVLTLSSKRIVVLIFLGSCLMAGAFRFLSRRAILAFLLVVLVAGGYLLSQQSPLSLQKDALRTFYRIESYPFSWHIARKHPFLGIGLLAPRQSFLDDYQPRYPHVPKEHFEIATEWIRTSENIFLTLMTDLGLPFLLLYSGCLVVLFRRLVLLVLRGRRRVGALPERMGPGPAPEPSCHSLSRSPPGTPLLPPFALWMPLTASILHYNVFDGLLYPQLCWYFHLLLGLIPSSADEEHRLSRLFPRFLKREIPEPLHNQEADQGPRDSLPEQPTTSSAPARP